MCRYILIAVFCLFSSQLFAQNITFLAKEYDKIIVQEGDVEKRFPPQSSFKIPLAYIGFDAGFLKDEHNPVLTPDPHEEFFINAHKGPHSPREWIRDSVVWYSQKITQAIGLEKFKQYVHLLNYGNQDVSGDEGKNNGLTHSWLSSSLKISPKEQVAFLQKILNQSFPLSQYAYEKAKSILYLAELHGGWKLFGKTGNGKLKDQKGKQTNCQHGWFVGWIERGEKKIVFATHLEDDAPEKAFASFRAKSEALNRLFSMTNQIDQ